MVRNPSQSSSYRTCSCFSLRLCFVHNQVNARLGHPEFDCANLDATYDCGCGDEPIGKSDPRANMDPPDFKVDGEFNKDDVTGVGIIKGGR